MYLTVKEVANILKACDQTIRNEIKKGRLRAFKIGESKKCAWRIHQSELEIYIEKGFQKFDQKQNIQGRENV